MGMLLIFKLKQGGKVIDFCNTSPKEILMGSSEDIWPLIIVVYTSKEAVGFV